MSTALLEKTAFRMEVFDAIMKSPDGPIKQASESGSKFVRIRLREQAISPAILPLTEIDVSALSQFVNTDKPGIIGEMEAGQAGPTSGPLNDTGDQTSFMMNKYELHFYYNRSPVFTKNVWEIQTYKSDIRQLIVDNCLRDLSRRKDFKFFGAVDETVGIVNGGISPITGEVQNILYPGRMDRNNLINIGLLLADRAQPTGVQVMNIRTWSEVKRWPRNEMGGDMAQKFILEGSDAFKTSDLDGVKTIVTMFNDLIANGVVYQFAPPNYLGEGATLQPATMYVEKKKSMLSFSCEEMIGFTIANANGVQKVSFHDLLGPNGGDGRLPVNSL